MTVSLILSSDFCILTSVICPLVSVLCCLLSDTRHLKPFLCPVYILDRQQAQVQLVQTVQHPGQFCLVTHLAD